MPALPRFAIDLLQDASSTRVGGAIASQAFLATARLAARDFARLRGAVGVYLTGSWTRPGAAAPGYSDIDLLVSVDVPTLEDEMALRAGMHRTQARWNVLANVLKHVDYVEQRDVRTLLAGGAAHWVDADDRFVSLAGHSDLAPGTRPPRRDAVQRVVSSLDRWARVSHVLLDPTFVRPDVITRRAAERLLASIVADALHLNPNEPPKTLIAQGRERLPELAGFRVPIAASASRFAAAHAAATLRVLERACASYAFPFEMASQAPPQLSPRTDFDRSARALGFEAGEVVEFPPPRGSGMAILLSSEEPEAAVARLLESWPRLVMPRAGAEALRPILVTRQMWPALRLMSPVPEAGDALGGRDTVWGALPALGPRERASVAVSGTLALFYRPRSRAFRVDRSAASKLRGLAFDVLHTAPMIRAYRLGASLVRPAQLPEHPNEEELLARLREFIDEERPPIRAALGLSREGR